jgi:RNA polymerase sigma-70 factor (ECF subfamily)
MERHMEPVHRFLLSLQATPEDAEDALQECFVSAWRAAATYQGAGSARGWLFSIARNALRRQHRKRVGEPAEWESFEQLGVQAGWGEASDFSARFEIEDELSWALEHLPHEEREVVVLRDLHGLSGEEAAEALDLSVAAMKSRLHRGRLRMMAVLRETEVEDA